MSTALSHLTDARGLMLSGAENSQTDSEMLEAAWAWADKEVRGLQHRSPEQKSKKMNDAKLKNGYIEQLFLLFKGVTWDGDLISKAHRDELVKVGLAERVRGYNFITAKGIAYLLDLGIVHS